MRNGSEGKRGMGGLGRGHSDTLSTNKHGEVAPAVAACRTQHAVFKTS